MSSSLLSTMAILLANYDEQKDYLTNFEPFVLDRLKAWPGGQEVRPKGLRESLGEAFTLPSIPINTVTALRDRAKDAGYIRRSQRDGKDYPNEKALASIMEIAPKKNEALGHFAALADALRAYADEVFDLEWSEEEAEQALDAFVEEFGVEMAMARHEGEVGGTSRGADEALVVVHAFARRALERDPTNLEYLEEMVKGSMLTNVIYFQDLGSWSPSLGRLVVYLDTPFVLRALDIHQRELTSAALELMRMLAEFKVPVRIFEHTVEEVLGVLEGIGNSLTRARRNEFDPNTVSAIHRESIEHLLQRGWGTGDIQEIISDIGGRLQALGVVEEGTPDHTRDLAVDERHFETKLEAEGYTQEHQIIKDVRSLTAVHRLRGGQPCRDLSQTRAILLTSNWRLVRASHRFFREQGLGSPVPHCISDVSLTTQLWLRRSAERRDIPRKILMAEAYAALNPSAELWSRYLKKIATKKADGSIDDRQVKVLVLSGAAREGLLEVTHGNPQLVTDETPLDVLAHYEEVTKRPAVEEAAKAKKRAEKIEEENKSLLQETAELRRQVSSQDRQIGDAYKKIDDLQKWRSDFEQKEQDRARRRALLRRFGGIAVAVIVLVVVVTLAATDEVTDELVLSLLGVAAGLSAVASIGWGFGRSWASIWRIIAGVSAIGGLIGLIYALLTGDPSNSAKP